MRILRRHYIRSESRALEGTYMQDPFVEREDEDQIHHADLDEEKETNELKKASPDSLAETEEHPKLFSNETVEIKRPEIDRSH